MQLNSKAIEPCVTQEAGSNSVATSNFKVLSYRSSLENGVHDLTESLPFC